MPSLKGDKRITIAPDDLPEQDDEHNMRQVDANHPAARFQTHSDLPGNMQNKHRNGGDEPYRVGPQ